MCKIIDFIKKLSGKSKQRLPRISGKGLPSLDALKKNTYIVEYLKFLFMEKGFTDKEIIFLMENLAQMEKLPMISQEAVEKVYRDLDTMDMQKFRNSEYDAIDAAGYKDLIFYLLKATIKMTVRKNFSDAEESEIVNAWWVILSMIRREKEEAKNKKRL